MNPNQQTKSIEYGALDAAVNYALNRIRFDNENETNGTRYTAESNLEICADEAFGRLLHEMGPDVADRVRTHFGFELGLKIAAIVSASPLGDTRNEIRELLAEAVDYELRQEKLSRGDMVASHA